MIPWLTGVVINHYYLSFLVVITPIKPYKNRKDHYIVVTAHYHVQSFSPQTQVRHSVMPWCQAEIHRKRDTVRAAEEIHHGRSVVAFWCLGQLGEFRCSSVAGICCA